MKKFYVYTLFDSQNQVFYVGKGSISKNYNRIDFHTKYWKHHTHTNKHLYNKIKKLNGQFSVNTLLQSDDESLCLKFEKQKILEIKRAGNKLCNLTDGGEGVSGWKHTAESKKKMSLNRDVDISKRNLKKAVEANVNRRKATGLGIEKLYETRSIYEIKAITGLDFATIKRYLVENGLYEKNKNRRVISEDGRVSKSIGQKSRTDRKEVNQYTLEGVLVQKWKCAQDIVKLYGSCIRDCLRGRQKTAYGYIWKYEKD